MCLTVYVLKRDGIQNVTEATYHRNRLDEVMSNFIMYNDMNKQPYAARIMDMPYHKDKNGTKED